MKRKLVSIVVLVSLLLVGCGGESELTALNEISALNTESKSSDPNLTLSEKESMVYAQVSERSLLDLSKLEPCSDTDLQEIVTYMDNVDAQLTGQIEAKEGVIDEALTDYLLAEFQKTPYYWQRSQTIVRGIDSASRCTVVDVIYSTIGYNKELIEHSYLTLGEPDYEKKAKYRYDRWLSILTQKYQNTSFGWEADLNKFKQVYGDPEKIIAAQRELTLTKKTFESGNQITYEGLTDSTIEKQGATMCVRFVLVPDYVMGVNLGITCKHMYVVDYTLNTDPTDGLDLFQEDGYGTVTHNIVQTMKSYFKCIDENYMDGLYKLTYRFDRLDRYFRDMFDTTYLKHNNYTVSVFDISGTKITCGVQVSSKVRAKGSNMTFPMYTDRYYVELQLVEKQLQVINMVLLSRKLEGEPVIDTEAADTEGGFNMTVDLPVSARQDIEKLICSFSEHQLSGDTDSAQLMEIVDYSMSENKIGYLREAMASLTGQKKVVWLQNYQSGNNNYISVKCKEQYQQKDNSIVEAIVTYEFISKGSQWYVYGYDVVSSVRLDSTNLITTNALCIVEPGNTVEYNSQVTEEGTQMSEGAVSGSGVSLSGVVFNHEPVMPQVKLSTAQDDGLVKLDATMVSPTQVTSFLQSQAQDDVTSQFTYDDLVAADKEAGRAITDENSVTYITKLYVALYYNIVNNRYTKSEREQAVEDLKNQTQTAVTSWGTNGGVIDSVRSIIARFK